MKKLDGSTKKLIITISIIVVLMVAITIIAWPYMKKLTNPADREHFQKWVESLGIWGWLVLLALMVLQIVVAVIPGGPTEIISGALYGTWGGLAVCTVGSVIGSIIAFALSKRYGLPLVYKIFGKQKVDNFKFLQDSKRIETVTLILFLIPGMPKDMLTYLAGISSIKMTSFIVISCLARIPATLMSTMVGASVTDGKWKLALILAIAIIVICVVGIIFKDKIISYCHKLSEKFKHHKHPEDKSSIKEDE